MTTEIESKPKAGCLRCPACGEFTATRIRDTNKRLKGAVRRRHVCLKCNADFRTNETVDETAFDKDEKRSH